MHQLLHAKIADGGRAGQADPRIRQRSDLCRFAAVCASRAAQNPVKIKTIICSKSELPYEISEKKIISYRWPKKRDDVHSEPRSYHLSGISDLVRRRAGYSGIRHQKAIGTGIFSCTDCEKAVCNNVERACHAAEVGRAAEYSNNEEYSNSTEPIKYPEHPCTGCLIEGGTS